MEQGQFCLRVRGEQNIAGSDLLAAALHQIKVAAVAHDHRRGEVKAQLANGSHVKFHQQLASFDRISLPDTKGKMLTLEGDGVPSHMDEQLRLEALGDNPQCMAGVHKIFHCSIRWGIKPPLLRNHGNSIAQNLPRKGGVRHRLYGNHLAGQGAENLLISGWP